MGPQTEAFTRTQLFECADPDLRRTLYTSLGDRDGTINVSDLLKEMKDITVEKQSELFNQVKMMERDESIRKYLFRLKDWLTSVA